MEHTDGASCDRWLHKLDEAKRAREGGAHPPAASAFPAQPNPRLLSTQHGARSIPRLRSEVDDGGVHFENNLIRNSPAPAVNDNSDHAQIVWFAQSPE